MQGQKHDFDTALPNVRVHVTWPKFSGKPIVIRAYAVEKKSGIRLTGAKEKKIVAKSEEEIPYKQRILVNRVLEYLPRKERLARKTVVTNEASAMEDTLDYIEENDITVNPRWSKPYQRSKLINFRRQFLPHLLQYRENWSDFSVTELKRELVEEVLFSGHSIGHEGTAINTVRKKLVAAAAVYSCMRTITPSLPDIDLNPIIDGRQAQREQVKSLPNQVRDRLASWIVTYVDVDPRLAAAAAQMMDGGARTAEAAAIHQSQFLLENGKIYGTYIFFQVKNGRRVPSLKTESSYRCVPVSEWGRRVLARCFASIGELDEAEPLCDPDQLSSVLRQALKECGVDEDFLREAEKELRQVPDYDANGQLIPLDVSAYVLRRDWATRARTICGFTTEEIDFCLGHAPKKSKGQSAELKGVEEIKKLSEKLEHYIADVRYSGHPAVNPLSVIHGTDLEIFPFDLVRIRNSSDEPLRIEIDLTNVMSNESLTVIMPVGSCSDWRKRCLPTKGVRPRELPIIGVQKKLSLKGDGAIVSKESAE